MWRNGGSTQTRVCRCRARRSVGRSVVRKPLRVRLEPGVGSQPVPHNNWKIRDGFFRRVVDAVAQTPDGYLWLGTEFGLLRFDGVRFAEWDPPRGQELPSTNIRSLLAACDGTLWIGTADSFASWRDGKLTRYS